MRGPQILPYIKGPQTYTLYSQHINAHVPYVFEPFVMSLSLLRLACGEVGHSPSVVQWFYGIDK